MTAAMKDSRASERTSHHYTMKTSTIQTPSALSYQTHHHATTPSIRTGRSRPSTPSGSPKVPYSMGQPYSVGQPYPPKLSPGRGSEKRSSSPSYFGLVVEDSADPRDSSLLPHRNWSPASSGVKPFAAAAVPKNVPLDANPEFEAFKRQVDMYRDRGMGLPTSTAHMLPPTSSPFSIPRPKFSRWHTQFSNSTTTSTELVEGKLAVASATRDATGEANRMDLDRDGPHDSAYVSEESKRNSATCMTSPPLFPRLPSLDAAVTRIPAEAPERVSLSRVEDRDPRLSITSGKVELPLSRTGAAISTIRPQTAPLKEETTGPSMIMPDQLRDMMEDPNVRVLLLDVRSAQTYSRSRIRDALNLCIPTTLLKRPNFNLKKLQQTFQRTDQQGIFSEWRKADCLVVYDAASSEKAEAMTAVNMIKKFTNEGYSGPTHILRGGYKLFEEEHPDMIYHQAPGNPATSPEGSSVQKGLAPVIGGVMLPASSHNPNAFFSNIRQNMDLADGVGQMDILKPQALEMSTVPRWLRDAAEEANHGKRVSDTFLRIEHEEMARMKEAFSLINCDVNTQKRGCVQLCGIEQGERNRYKDILPFEHSRVKLQGNLGGQSDYINASHIKASRSNKKYLASQGPLPETFEHFWSVIWDQDVRVIVMLTAEHEAGFRKCHVYWNSHEYGPLKLKKLSETKVSLDIDTQPSGSRTSEHTSAAESGRRRANTTTAFEAPATSSPQASRPGQGGDSHYVIIRKFALSHAEHPFAPMREITHLHYPSWPDHGVPARASHVLALVELANVMQRASLPTETASSPVTAARKPGSALAAAWADEPESNPRVRPMLVHCSAGCGRTGAFCTVDSVIDMLKRQRLSKMKRYGAGQQGAKSGGDADNDVAMEEVIASPHGDASPLSERSSGPNNPPSRRWSGQSASARSTPETPALDLSWVDDDRVDLIQVTVEDFRTQRLSMVQSLRQYVLCYEAILEWVWRVQDRGGHGDGASRGRARSGSLRE